MSNHGSFSGNPKTEWLVDESGSDRNMRLLEDFWYLDPDGRRWPAPRGSVVDGASIPRPLWSVVGSPYVDDYRRASIVHDVACDDPTVDRKAADVMFYQASRAGGCSFLQAMWLYAGVRIGAWTDQIFTAESLSRERLLFRMPDRITADEQFVQAKFQEITADLQRLRAEASIHEMDVVIDRHLRFGGSAMSSEGMRP